jgi:hypothetical protein
LLRAGEIREPGRRFGSVKGVIILKAASWTLIQVALGLFPGAGGAASQSLYCEASSLFIE